MNPATKPPNPTVARSAPDQSTRPALAMRLSGICQSEMAITAGAGGAEDFGTADTGRVAGGI